MNNAITTADKRLCKTSSPAVLVVSISRRPLLLLQIVEVIAKSGSPEPGEGGAVAGRGALLGGGGERQAGLGIHCVEGPGRGGCGQGVTARTLVRVRSTGA